MKEKVLTTMVTFETTTQAIAMERECKKNKFTGSLARYAGVPVWNGLRK